MNKKNMMEK